MARQNIRLPIWSILLMSFGLWACDDDGGTTTIYVDADLSGQCAPACDPNACQACDTSGETPACVNTCGEGTTCQAGACVAEAPAACAPACDACQTCDMSGASPVCVDLCAEGTECVEGACVAEAPAACEPACDACQTCDMSGDAPVCVDNCAEGTECVEGACVAVTPAACEPACDACQTCDMSGAAPVCVDNCAEGTECVEGACVAVTPAACEPACDACQTCDMSGDAPVCVDNCAEGTECVEGACVAVTPATCEPACDACQTCDMSGDAPVCVDNCAEGTECIEGACVAVAPATCEPACDACQTCDMSGDAPICVDNCAEGTECVEGVCQAPVVPTCEACGPCQLCDTTGEAPICVSICGEAEVCVEGACRRASVHANLDALNGPFDNASAVTTACLNCHQDDATRFMATSHWRWTGPTPGLAGHEADNTIGKRNLINNFCIATVSNEARCTQCHAGYDWRDDNYDLNDATKVDCLVCHAQPSLYSKATTTAGNPPDTVDLEMAARSVGPTTVANCGKCHFGAGGGDNVKKGDLGSALLQATPESDVHMGRGMACAGCHAGDQHNVLGASVHGAVDNGRLSCADCHGVEPHVNAALNNHALDIACQTCHIPAFSRQQPTKMDWDWSTAGDRTRGENGVVTGTTAGGATVTVYDAMKGDFVWIENVRPEYAWHDGTIARMTTQDQHPEGAGTEEMPVILGRPLATHDAPDALIWPFKVMRGRQPIDPTRRLVIVPKLFGPGGFWGAIPAAADYTPEAVAALWATALTNGARLAGQIGAEEAYAVGDWVWGYTEMYMGINHEVAPAAAALGCMDCHNNPAFDFEALGYSCDPMTGGAGCGSRH